MTELRCYSVSLGCPKNRVDTEHLLGSLGVEIMTVGEIELADVVFINTCGFIAPAVQESVHVIAQAIADIEGIKKRPLLVVGGCMVGRYSEKILASELPEVDLWLDNAELFEWPDKLRRALSLEGNAVRGRLLSTPPSFAWLKISDGCRHKCAFCTIPKIRGPLISRPADEIVAEAENVLAQGVRELILVAQDVTGWGTDMGEGRDLRYVLDALLPLDGLDRLRLLYLYPSGLSKDLLRYLRDAGNPFVPYFDVPLQHSHPDILSRMGRPFAHDPRLVVDRIREFFPDAALRTSLIVGFPGETDVHYSDLVRFVEDVRFSHLGVFAYQPEEGTPAADMPNQVDEVLKERRRDGIMEIQRELSTEWLEQFNGSRMDVLVDSPHPEWPGLHTGRTWFQAPDIDGVTYISGKDVFPGAIVSADIVETREYDLVALADA